MPPTPRALGALFFFSGFAALVYQVVWVRQLGLFFGSDVYAAAITLSVFMGGLSAGSALAERTVDRLGRPLRWYGWAEVGIGAYALVFGALLAAFTPALREVYRVHFETAPVLYHAARVLLAAAILLPPTGLMGYTLPLVTRALTGAGGVGKTSGTLYALNTLGALAGTLLAAFALIPTLGIAQTTAVAAGINLLVGLAVVLAYGRWRTAAPKPAEPAVAGASAHNFDPGAARVALWAIALSGLAALGLEVVWTRLLTLSFSGTVYGFALMLAAFLFGIFQGARMAARSADSVRDPVRRFALLELGLGFCVAALALVSYVVPKLAGALIWGVSALTGGNFALASVGTQALVSTALILVPTLLLGATFPLAVRICTPSPEQAGAGTGRVYAANTAGAIGGSLLAGFVLVPLLGARGSLLALAALFSATGALLWWQAHGRRGGALREAALPLGATLAVGVAAALLPAQTVLNYGQARSFQPTVVYGKEGISHRVDIVRNPQGETIMMVDGNVEADTSFIQRRHFVLKGHLPLLLHPAPREVAVVGLGLGLTLAATERNPEVASIQVVELSREMARAHEHLRDVNGGVLFKPKVSLRIDDGRNFLAMTPRRWDMITADPIHPRITGVGYLYTEEYYRGLRERLKPGGVVCQWMPMYHLSRRSFDVAFRTFARVFPQATFWYVRGHGLFVATADAAPVSYARLRERVAAETVAADLRSIEIPGAAELLAHCAMGPREIAAYLASAPAGPVNTDDNAHLEYATPHEFLHPTREIVAALEPHVGWDPALLTDATPEEHAAVRRAWDARRARLLPELEEPLR